MSRPRCPGQDMRYWKPGDVFDVRCPRCKTGIEFFKDEPSLKCPSCGKEVRNPKIDLGCAKWCAFAEQCLNEAPGASDAVESLRERLIGEMKATFGSDQRRINHALKVLEYAETILEAEGGDPLCVKAAAILHDIGIHNAERKHGSVAGRFREIEGPPIARTILEKLGIDENRIDHVCRIVGSQQSEKDIDTPEFRIIWDAGRLADIAEERLDAGREKPARSVARVFKTEKGRALAKNSD